jgi:hypothetical protein
MAINSPVRVDRTAGSNELVRLVQGHPEHLDQDDLNEKEVSSNNSVQSVHSGHSDADSLEAHVQEVEDGLASLDGDSASTSNKPTNNPGRAEVKARDFAAEKAAIEVDDESLPDAPREQVDLSGLSSDDSSFEENEQLLRRSLPRKTSNHTSQSKITRFASHLPKPSKDKVSASKPVIIFQTVNS